MKLSKSKRKSLAEQEKQQKLSAIQNADFWNKLQTYLDKEKTTPQYHADFEEVCSHFAKIYNVKGLLSYMKKHPEMPQLTFDNFAEWLSISDMEMRQKAVLNWIDTAKHQKKEVEQKLIREFNKLHPYRIVRPVQEPPFWSDLIVPSPIEIIMDITSNETFHVSQLKKYHAAHHPEINLDEAIKGIGIYYCNRRQ